MATSASYELTTPLQRSTLEKMHAGDTVRLSGTIYTARDAAHARFEQLLAEGRELPFPLAGTCLYYAGPTPAPPGHVIGSVGPTTSGRMDKYTPAMLDAGLSAMIGKGVRSQAVLDALCRNGAVYFGFVGGAGALAASCITACDVIAFEDLGSEAVRRLVVRDFPLTVLCDAHGGDLYRDGPAAYLRSVSAGEE